MRTPALAIAFALAACADDAPENTVAFELDAPLAGDTFWAMPFPSDLRLTADGRPDLAGFPNRRALPVVEDLLSVARERRGFPVMPIAWFQFTGEAPLHSLDAVTETALIIDIDPASPEKGRIFPVVAQTLPTDYYGDHLVAVAPRPGIVLRADTRYATVLRAAFAPDASTPPAFAQLAGGASPGGRNGAAATALYAPLWSVLADAGIDDVLVATVFTTGDEVSVLSSRSEAIRTAHDATISNVQLDGASAQVGFCSLTASVTFPQFQVGAAPFSTEGRFVLDDAGVPIQQGTQTVPLAITLPLTAMPTAGYPLWQYFHGSGGLSRDLIDEGPSLTSDGLPVAGEGPGAVVARRGIAAAASALPVNSERLTNAGSYDYLNINNLAAFPYTFQQGVFEQRLLLDALLALELPDCNGGTAHFDPASLVAGGHSMGGMYTNMIGAVEPRFGALTPFGAGGFWNMMILDTAIIPGARGLLGGVLGVDADQLTFANPALALIELGWEIADPINAMARLSRRPLPGLPARHVYQPVGLDDKYFPNQIFDAAALAYGNEQVGEVVWPGTQDALSADGMDGLLTYPVTGNRTTTSVVVQYRDGGIVDAHQIYRQLDEVKFQYGCFLASYLRDGVPTVPAPAAISAPCP